MSHVVWYGYYLGRRFGASAIIDDQIVKIPSSSSQEELRSRIESRMSAMPTFTWDLLLYRKIDEPQAFGRLRRELQNKLRNNNSNNNNPSS